MIYSFLVALFEWKVNDISIAEIITILFIGYTFFYKPYKNSSFSLSLFFLFSFVIWIIINNLTKIQEPYFVASSFLNNIIRLCVYALGFYKITEYLTNHVLLYNLIGGLKFIVIISCVLGIIEFAFSLVNIDINFLILNNHTTVPPVNTRASSIFSEPAHFSIFIAISTFLIMRYYYINGHLKKINHFIFIVFFSLMCTLSFIGYTFFLFLLFYYIKLSLKNKDNNFVKFVIPAILTVILAIFCLQNTPLFQDMVINRWLNVLGGTDGSSSHRVLGAIEIVTLLQEKKLFTGIGLGQIIPYFSSIKINLEHFWYQEGNVGINNILSQITAETGIVGLILFLFFVISYTKNQLIYFLVFIIFSFSWGFFNTPFFWFYIYLSKALIDQKYHLTDENRTYYVRLLREHPTLV